MGKLVLTENERGYFDELAGRIDRLVEKGDVEKLRLLRVGMSKRVLGSEYTTEAKLVFENMIYYITKVLISFEEGVWLLKLA